ncbi:MAG: low-specificity L-threonine aldolase [Proteobacteria bacterium]|nr:low-specificity L-threonine aldolase [Pseudomonadota bacterium]
MNVIDLRSDTITRPTPAMREAMAHASVGDDVFGDDPSVNALQERSAALLGKEAALFVPSGTMANQIAIRTHTEPGDEIIVETGAHIYQYEGGGYAALAGVSIRCVDGTRGLLDADQVRGGIRPEGGLSHFPVTKLIALENTANRGGGTIYSPARVSAIAGVAREHELRLHLDGARVFNAAVGLGLPVADVVAEYDSISFCLSKGLGAPVGSLLVGSRPFIDRAHRFRKMLGGGMRQAGILAAGGLHALEHHVDRMADDHARARRLGAALAEFPGVTVDLQTVETNMVYADLGGTGLDADGFVSGMADRGVALIKVSPSVIRVVTHLDVDDAGIDHAIAASGEVLGAARA